MDAPGLAHFPLEEERELVGRIKRGDRAAAATLYQWYGDRLYRQAILPRLPNRELAEDVLVDTFRTAIEKIEQYETRDCSIFFWLRRIAINRAIDVHRAHQKARRIEDDVEPEHVMSTPADSPDRSPEVAETRQMVDEALSRINPRYAEALRLRLLQDLDREECARAMQVTIGNFDVILHRAAKAFRRVYPP